MNRLSIFSLLFPPMLILCIFSANTFAQDIAFARKKCVEFGFAAGTTAHADCVKQYLKSSPSAGENNKYKKIPRVNKLESDKLERDNAKQEAELEAARKKEKQLEQQLKNEKIAEETELEAKRKKLAEEKAQQEAELERKKRISRREEESTTIKPIPISVALFADEGLYKQSLGAIIKADLQRSGFFSVMESPGEISETVPIQYSDWRAKGAEALVVGRVSKLSNGRFELRYRLHDTAKAGELSSFIVTVQPQSMRYAAHRIANDIFEKLTGIRGAFATRIAYVIKSDSEYRLEVADSDGENPIAVARSSEPLISPVWSPDGSKLAYVSFENKKKPVVYIQELASSKRIALADFKGSNSAPAWSPDGKKLALALSRDGLTQIYTINADGSNLKRITSSAGIDTEPFFAPDGQSLYFTSDRSGGLQIYKISIDGGDAKRITFEGSYNASPRISPDGKILAYISRREGRLQLYILDLSSLKELRLSDGIRDQSPRFAPNSRYLLYSTESGGNGTLAVVSIDGQVRYRLTSSGGNLKESAWGPFGS